MIFGNRSNQELKYAKAKAKGTEFFVDPSDMPRFKLDSDDLHYSSIFVISNYLAAKLSGQTGEEYIEDLRKVAAFYDASSNDARNIAFSDGYWLLAMATYFLLGNYGSALVAARNVIDTAHYGQTGSLLHKVILYLLGLGDDVQEHLPSLFAFIRGEAILERDVVDEAASMLNSDNPEDAFFSKILYVTIMDSIQHSSRMLLPAYTNLPLETWKNFLSSNDSPKLLWQAQRQIGKSGIFAGENGFVQLPTGTGKTKSIELLLRSRILANQCSLAIVVAPLRALCSEITRDLTRALKGLAGVNQASDVLEIDDWLDLKFDTHQVLVFTPEKLGFVIHHNPELLESADLFVFDEAHLLDSESRGPSYELLLTELFRTNTRAQKVMISAVVSNASEIAEWAFGNAARIVSSEQIQVSEKSVGIVHQNGAKVSYIQPSDINAEDYFVIVDIQPQDLKLKGRERKRRRFPELGDSSQCSRDLALYYANRLLPNGAAAIYVPKKTSLRNLFKRLAELMEREADIHALKESIARTDKDKLISLIRMHYGNDSWLENGVNAGILPHYGDLQGALRPSVEFEIEQSRAKCIACTSTLAEGVNLPIKYLLITGARTGMDKPKTRDFQNLIGRTARSGHYSEGSILLTDAALTKNKRLYAPLINPSNTERCESAILNLLADEEVYTKTKQGMINGDFIVKQILGNIDDPELEKNLAADFMEVTECEQSKAEAFAFKRIRPLEAIESYLAGVMAADETTINIDELCSSTFAYVSSNEDMRSKLLLLFRAIYDSLKSRGKEKASLCHLTQIGVRKTTSLIEWINSPEGRIYIESDCTDLLVLSRQFICSNPGVCSPLNEAQFSKLIELWISGYNLLEMKQALISGYPELKNLDVTKMEKLVSSVIKYSLSHYISCLIDAVRCNPILSTQSNIENLEMLQRKVKYGVSTLQEVVICEEIIDDRMVAKAINSIIDKREYVDVPIIKAKINMRRDDIEELLEELPMYCKVRFHDWTDAWIFDEAD